MPKVLIVDDDRAMTSLLKTLLELEPEGFEVAVAPRGGQAIDKALADPPDIFIVDFNLTDMDGVELVSHLRQPDMFPHTPIVMASGLDVEAEAKAAGIDLFLLKPFEPGDLAGILLDLIG